MKIAAMFILTGIVVVGFGCAVQPGEPALEARGAIQIDGLCTTAADCPPSDRECAAVVCTGAGHCELEQTYPGRPCNDGIGLCSDIGTCQAPVGECKLWIEAPDKCDDAVDCDDESPCTEDVCVSGSCEHLPLSDGEPCLQGFACDRGACCIPYGPS